uniref:Major facilitator superfamily (MFS) profile domain-containing protein n=1 Tax=Arion vulgaris TaxID=1028688 RepID=A0A0B6YKD1_9EUPU
MKGNDLFNSTDTTTRNSTNMVATHNDVNRDVYKTDPHELNVDGVTEKRPDDGQWLEQTTVHMKDETISFWKLFLDNWIYVVTYCSVFGSFGVCVGFLGPTVFDLGCQTHSDLKKMNWVFFVQLIMTLVGSISAGCMADRVPVHSLMLCGAVGVSLSMFFIPVCDNLSSLIFVLIVMGWCMGCLDCLANLIFVQCRSFLLFVHALP